MQTKIFQRMPKKFPAIQHNHQKSILFHEIIPLLRAEAAISYEISGRKN
jgi:hypothetical protein